VGGREILASLEEPRKAGERHSEGTKVNLICGQGSGKRDLKKKGGARLKRDGERRGRLSTSNIWKALRKNEKKEDYAKDRSKGGEGMVDKFRNGQERKGPVGGKRQPRRNGGGKKG